MSDVPTFDGHREGCTYRVDLAWKDSATRSPACHLYQFPHGIYPPYIKAIGHNRFATRQECADWIEANLPGVTIGWNVQQVFLPGMWGAPPLEKPWL